MTEDEKAWLDLVTYGTSFVYQDKDGNRKHIPLEEVLTEEDEETLLQETRQGTSEGV